MCLDLISVLLYIDSDPLIKIGLLGTTLPLGVAWNGHDYSNGSPDHKHYAVKTSRGYSMCVRMRVLGRRIQLISMHFCVVFALLIS